MFVKVVDLRNLSAEEIEKVLEQELGPKAEKKNEPQAIRSVEDLLKIDGVEGKEQAGTIEVTYGDSLITTKDLEQAVNILVALGADIVYEARKDINTEEELNQFIKDISKAFIFDRFNLEFYKVSRFKNNAHSLRNITARMTTEEIENIFKVNLNVLR